MLATTTALIVAHRPSTVQLADRVALLQDGRVTAVGTHSELIAHNEHYRYVISSLDDDIPPGRERALPEEIVPTTTAPISTETGTITIPGGGAR